ncbi:MAG: tetratricopeptide repeat protein [Thermoleophilia bacterium]
MDDVQVGRAVEGGAIEGPGTWVSAFGWLLLAVAAPLAFSTHAAATFFTVKLGPLYVGAALVVLGAAWPSATGPAGGPGVWRRVLRVDGAEILAGVFLLVGLVSVVTASSRVTALLGTYNQGTGWLFWVTGLAVWTAMRRTHFDPRLVRVLVAGFLVGATVVAALAVLQAVRWEPLHFRLGFRPDGRVGSTLGNPLYMGAFLTVAVISSLQVAVGARTWVGRAAALAAGCTLVAGLAFSWSRGAWLALGVGVVVWFAASLLGDRTSWRRAAAGVAGILAVALVMALGVAPAVAPARGAGTVGATAAGSSSKEAGSTVQTRVLIWGEAADAVAERPILGWGPNNFRFAALRYTTAEKLKLEPNTRDGDAHSLPLELAATWGVPATLLFLGWVAAVALGMWRRRHDPQVALGAGVLAAFLAASLTMPQNLVVTPVALGLIALAPGRWDTDPEVLEGPRDRSGLVRALRGVVLADSAAAALRVAVLALTVVALVVTGAGSWLWYRADVHYQAGEIRGDLGELTQAVDTFPLVDAYLYSLGTAEGRAGFTEGRAALTNQAVTHLREGLSLSPRGVESLIALAGLYLQVSDWQQASAVAQQAVEYAPNEPQAHANLAYALLRRGDRTEAEAAAQRALSIDVGSPRILNTVGLYYRDAGDLVRARELFEEALRIDPGFGPARDNLNGMQ